MYMSFFRRPVRTVKPCRTATPADLAAYLRSPYAWAATSYLRTLSEEKRRPYKQTNFDFCTPGGTFRTRKREELATYSGLLVLDIDHVSDPYKLLARAVHDWEPTLGFVSPSGEGVKLLIDVSADLQNLTHCTPDTPLSPAQATEVSKVYTSLFQRIREAWNAYAPSSPLDPSGADISRACYLPADPLAYLAPTPQLWNH